METTKMWYDNSQFHSHVLRKLRENTWQIVNTRTGEIAYAGYEYQDKVKALQAIDRLNDTRTEELYNPETAKAYIKEYSNYNNFLL